MIVAMMTAVIIPKRPLPAQAPKTHPSNTMTTTNEKIKNQVFLLFAVICEYIFRTELQAFRVQHQAHRKILDV